MVNASRITDFRTVVQEVHFNWAVPKGWWTDLDTGMQKQREWEELCTLVHSELSEGMEGFRKNKQDTHLPHRPMLEVELADALIRIADMCGGFGYNLVDMEVCFDNDHSIMKLIGECHAWVSALFNAKTKNDREYFASMCCGHIQYLAEKCGYDMLATYREKMAYNETREDHKLENRRKADGKKV